MIVYKFWPKLIQASLIVTCGIAISSCDKIHDFERKTFEDVKPQEMIRGGKRYPKYNQQYLAKQGSAVDYHKTVVPNNTPEHTVQEEEKKEGIFSSLFNFGKSMGQKAEAKLDIATYGEDRTTKPIVAQKKDVAPESLNKKNPNEKEHFFQKLFGKKPSELVQLKPPTGKKNFFTDHFGEQKNSKSQNTSKKTLFSIKKKVNTHAHLPKKAVVKPVAIQAPTPAIDTIIHKVEKDLVTTPPAPAPKVIAPEPVMTYSP